MLSLEKIPFLFFCRDCAGSIKPLFALALSSDEIAKIWWQSLLKPIDLERKVLPPINTPKPESVSYMQHPLFFYLIISVTLQYETFSI